MQKKINKERIEDNQSGLVLASSKNETSAEDLRIDWSSFIRFFNETLVKHHSKIAPIEWISAGYKGRVNKIVKSYKTKKVLVVAIDRMARSDFLNGKKVRSYQFIASFTWLFGKDENFVRCLDGFYDNPPEIELTPEEQRQQELERYRAQQEARRAEARRIDEEEHERRERERKEWARNCVTYEEYQRMLKMQKGPLPTSPRGGEEN